MDFKKSHINLTLQGLIKNHGFKFTFTFFENLTYWDLTKGILIHGIFEPLGSHFSGIVSCLGTDFLLSLAYCVKEMNLSLKLI